MYTPTSIIAIFMRYIRNYNTLACEALWLPFVGGYIQRDSFSNAFFTREKFDRIFARSIVHFVCTLRIVFFAIYLTSVR